MLTVYWDGILRQKKALEENLRNVYCRFYVLEHMPIWWLDKSLSMERAELKVCIRECLADNDNQRCWQMSSQRHSWWLFFFFKISLVLFFFFNTLFYLFIYLFIYDCVGSLSFRVRAFSSCGKWGPLFITVRGPLTIAAPPVAGHRLQTRRLSSCGSRAQLLRGM